MRLMWKRMPFCIDRLAECPDQSALYRGSIPEGPPPQGPYRGPYLRVPTREGPHQNVSTRALNRRKKIPQRAPTKHILSGPLPERPL